MEVKVKDLIETLEKLADEEKEKIIIGIGTYSGFDRPCEYVIHLNDHSEIMIGKGK